MTEIESHDTNFLKEDFASIDGVKNDLQFYEL